ncbi:MAG TPA: hypothetical protein VF969_08590 [Burkholderiales bacterium]
MSNDSIGPGCVLHWTGFQFEDGAVANKYFVIVGAQPNKNYLAVIATSKMRRGRKPDPGGNPEGGWYHIPGGGKDFFPVDTWLLFEAPQELSAAQVHDLRSKNEIQIKGEVDPGNRTKR